MTSCVWVWAWQVRGLTSDFIFYIFSRVHDLHQLRCIRVPWHHFWFAYFFFGAFFHTRVTGACPVTTDLIMRVNVRTTCDKNAACRMEYAFLLIRRGWAGRGVVRTFYV